MKIKWRMLKKFLLLLLKRLSRKMMIMTRMMYSLMRMWKSVKRW